MARGVVPIRASDEEHARWKKSAEEAGLKFSAWARNALNGASELDSALRRQQETEQKTAEQKRTTAFAQSGIGGKKNYAPDWRH